MNTTLQDVFLVTGVIAFTLFSVSLVVFILFLRRISITLQETIEAGNQLVENTMKAKYTMQMGIFKLLLMLFGGDKNHE